MKRKFKKILFFIIFFLPIFNSFSSEIKFENPGMKDEKFACSEFFNNLKISDDLLVSNFYTYNQWEDYGFDIKYIDDLAKAKMILDITKNGNLLVGQIYNDITASNIRPDDEILLINDKELKSDDDFYEILLDKNIDTIKLKLFNEYKGEYSAILKKSSNNYRILKYAIKSFDISDIDIKKSTYDVSITHDFGYFYDRRFYDSEDDENHPILDQALKNLIFYNNGLGLFIELII